MLIKHLILKNFRNYTDLEIYPNKNFNIIFGENGSGKTNLIEAVYYIGTLKSFRNVKRKNIININSNSASINASVYHKDLEKQVDLLLKEKNRIATVNSNKIVNLLDYFGNFSLTIFTPLDNLIIQGMPELRRYFIDRGIFSYDNLHLISLRNYKKSILNKNTLLKSQEYKNNKNLEMIKLWNREIAKYGGIIFFKRIKHINILKSKVDGFYKKITGAKENIKIKYLPASKFIKELCEHKNLTTEDLQTVLHKELDQNISNEIATRKCLIGPHRDDLEIYLNENNAKYFASQGQTKSIVLALKISELDYVKEVKGFYPIFLLDDISSELDQGRRRYLINFILEHNMQSFLTTTDLDKLYNEFNKLEKISFFEVKNGNLRNSLK